MANRRYDIDWLRNLGILLLFPFHSARIFDHWDPFYVKSHVLSWGLSWFIASTSYWFMPLLFWLAGSSIWYALQHRSYQQYMKDRISRLLIPFIFGLLLIVPPQGYFSLWQHRGDSPGNYFTFLKNYLLDFSDLSGYFGSFTPAHLWFILYLFVLSLIALPLFIYLKNKNGTSRFEKFHLIFSKPYVYILFFIILAATQSLPAPGGQNPFYYLAFLIMGFVTASHPNYQKMFKTYRFHAFILILILVPVWEIILFHSLDSTSFSPVDIFNTFLRSLNTWLTLIVILGYGNKFLNFSHKLVPYMNEASFPIYIIHQSILVVVGYFILKFNIGVWQEYLLIMAITFMISVIIYEFIIKRTPFTRWIFGVKIKTPISKKAAKKINNDSLPLMDEERRGV
ncbi:acyltransferase family protein [Neobacillus cucumis]|uniref:acyltransferase family protein n=1 Tax=Neobacillus cucumis TaxID=1740721 RepID=UPI0019639B24|nr:acyltransferase family protein [Neobacillus cucumis]MBM7655236.1 peptidoglycan/LPS O-acetylase OafA/YrhL [Neobacillus cucumis]